MAVRVDDVVKVLSYLYPITVLVYYMLTSIVAVVSLHTLRASEKPQRDSPGRRVVYVFLFLYIAACLAQLGVITVECIMQRQWPASEDTLIRPLSCVLVFALQLSQLYADETVVWYPFSGSWALGICFEIAITTPTIIGNYDTFGEHVHIVEVGLSVLRCCSLLFLLSWHVLGNWVFPTEVGTDEERQGLLKQDANGNKSSYGSTSNAQNAEFNWERRDRQAREVMEARLRENGNWFQYAKGFKLFLPYVWPFGNYVLQLKVVGVIFCLLTANLLNLLIPRQTGIIMDSLSGSNSASPWIAVVVFAVLRLADSESGIELLRSWLWIPIEYFSREALCRAAYSHMMHLSADFHDSKSTSDMMMALHGGSAISNVIESMLLQAVPMLIDMGIATVYLSMTFGPYQGLVTVATGGLFLILTSQMVGESKEASRNRRNALYSEHYVRQSGLLGWTTVSAFNQIGYEDNRHANVVAIRWMRERQYMMNWYAAVACQTLVLTSGLLASAFVAVWRIRDGKATPGSFAMLLMYWAQLTAPLKFFARLGKNISDDFIDAERLLDVMRTQPSVENKKNARPIKFSAGHVSFDKVSFSYDKQKQVIKEVSFEVPAGQTVAFVGATGAGKSTLLRLLNRFYDVTGGCIRIDGQDVREVDLYSLRDRIGVVPQNPILFDDTIMNNVRYGKITATDEEVFEACRAACIHDKINEFTDGYETRVGERGVKLSGGELQRVAIARAILKKPDMVLLDEATSAVDTDTEHQIQLSFKRLCEGRTTFIVAHRLSTIMNADRILVVEGGEVIEQGSHNELVRAKGRYADLWAKQVFIRPEDKSGINGAVINDLSSEQTQNEVTKVCEQKPDEVAEDGEAKPEVGEDDADKDSSLH